MKKYIAPEFETMDFENESVLFVSKFAEDKWND